MSELAAHRTLTFYAAPDPQDDKFVIGSISTNMQTTVKFFSM